jgi:hypothetical protein
MTFTAPQLLRVEKIETWSLDTQVLGWSTLCFFEHRRAAAATAPRRWKQLCQRCRRRTRINLPGHLHRNLDQLRRGGRWCVLLRHRGPLLRRPAVLDQARGCLWLCVHF